MTALLGRTAFFALSALFVVAWIAVAPAEAQLVRVKITVADDQGAAVGDLALRFAPEDVTGHERAATTNKKGQATVPNLDGAPYKLVLESTTWAVTSIRYQARSADNTLQAVFEEMNVPVNGMPAISFEPYSKGELEVTVTSAKNVRSSSVQGLSNVKGELTELNDLLVLGDWEGMLARAPAVVAAHPELAGGHYLYGVALWKSGRYAEAAEQLDLVEELDPSQEGLYGVQAALFLEYARATAETDRTAAMPLAERAADALREQLEQTPDSKNDTINLYSALELAGKREESMAVLQTLIEQWPTDPAPYMRLADLQIEDGNIDAAVATLEAMPGEKAGVADLLYNAGVVQYNNDDFAGAVKTADRALAIAPGTAILYQLKGQALIATGDHAGAIAAFKEYIRLAPDDSEIEQQLVEALEAEGN